MSDINMSSKTSWGNYSPCTQCGGACMRGCFGKNCDFIERVSTNRFEGYPPPPPPPAPVSMAYNTTETTCYGQRPQQCIRVAPNTLRIGEEHYMGVKGVPQYSYNGGYTTLFPTFVGDGQKYDRYPQQAGRAFYPPLTKTTAL